MSPEGPAAGRPISTNGFLLFLWAVGLSHHPVLLFSRIFYIFYIYEETINTPSLFVQHFKSTARIPLGFRPPELPDSRDLWHYSSTTPVGSAARGGAGARGPGGLREISTLPSYQNIAG